jgi:hypothetical protein
MHRKMALAAVVAFALLAVPATALAGDPLTSGVTSSVTETLPPPPQPVAQVVQAAGAATGTLNVNASALNGNAVLGDGGDTRQSVKNDTNTEASQKSASAGSKTSQHAGAATGTGNVNASALNGNAVKGDGGPTDQRISNHTNTKASNAAERGGEKPHRKVLRKVKHTVKPAQLLRLPELPKPDLVLPKLGLPEAPSTCSMGDWLKH